MINLETTFGHWETLAQAIKYDVADEELAFEIVGVHLVSNVLQYRSFIDDQRMVASTRYGQLLSLHSRWKRQMHKILPESERKKD